MKAMLTVLLSVAFLFTSPVWAGSQAENLDVSKVEFSDGITAAEALGIDTSKVTTMEKREALDLSKYGIEAGHTTVEKASSTNRFSIRLTATNRRFFQNQRNAFNWCDDVHRFTGLRNTCVVRQFGNNFYETNFRFLGTARGSSFGNVFNNIFNFLVDSGLLNQLFAVLLDEIFD